MRILSEKSQFIFDPIGENKTSIQKTNSDRRWKHFGRSECPDQALAAVGELRKKGRAVDCFSGTDIFR